jgi:1,4-alpha-glucan branching enzyme
MAASNRPFMGATPYVDPAGDGVTFRTWAPFASSVHVAGTFNGWSATATPLSSEGTGNWSADVPGVGVGAKYRFVMRNGSSDPIWRIDPYAREVTSSIGDGVIAATTAVVEPAGYQMPPWNELVMYELHVGSFARDPTREDGRGTFSSIVAKLPYLRDLGVNAIQLMPANEFAMDVSGGYNPAHLFAIESSYGGPDGLRRFVEAAHREEMAVIFDVVFNHWGPADIDHSLWRYDGWQQDDYGGIYFYNDWRADTHAWGAKNRPDYGRPEVRRFICDAALRWLEQRHCDGLRWDATNYIRNVRGSNWNHAEDLADGWSLMRRINDEIGARTPGRLSIAEDMQDNDSVTRRTADGGLGFGSQWSAGFVHPVRAAVDGSDDARRDLGGVADAIRQMFHGDAFQRVIYSESHDEVSNGKCRVPEQIWPGNADSWAARKRSTLAAALVFSAPGIPMIFQGQEFCEDGWFDDGRMLDWGKLARPHLAAVSLLYRDLARLRRNWFDTTRGLRGHGVNVHHVNHADKLLAFHRWDHGGPRDDVLVVANFANRSYSSYVIGFPRAGRWRVRLNSDASCYGPDFTSWPGYDTDTQSVPTDGMPCSGNLGIGPYSTLIFSQDR